VVGLWGANRERVESSKTEKYRDGYNVERTRTDTV
jgi:hypothetical protein